MHRVEHLVVDDIAGPLKVCKEHGPDLSVIHGKEGRHVLEKEHGRPCLAEDPDELEYHQAARIIEALPLAGGTERLARGTAGEDVHPAGMVHVPHVVIPGAGLEIGGILLFCMDVAVACKDDLMVDTHPLQGVLDGADPRKDRSDPDGIAHFPLPPRRAFWIFGPAPRPAFFGFLASCSPSGSGRRHPLPQTHTSVTTE